MSIFIIECSGSASIPFAPTSVARPKVSHAVAVVTTIQHALLYYIIFNMSSVLTSFYKII